MRGTESREDARRGHFSCSKPWLIYMYCTYYDRRIGRSEGGVDHLLPRKNMPGTNVAVLGHVSPTDLQVGAQRQASSPTRV